MNSLGTLLRTSLAVTLTLLPAIGARAQKPSYLLISAPLVLDQKTVIPGHTLDPGSYSIRIVDHLRDRFILRVEDSTGNQISTFIGLRTPDLGTPNLPHGPIFWSSAPRNRAAVRGFSFPNGNTVEFVYPKADAVALAKLNTNSVPAIDPESEGLKPDPKLSPEDRGIVTLWMLTATRVGPKGDTPAIAVKRFVPAAEASETTPPPAQVASSAPPAMQPKIQPKQSRPANVQLAAAEPAPRIHSSVKKLPQTSSDLPLLLLCSILSLSSAATLHLVRSRA